MGSRVIKVENPDGGDLRRSRRVSNARVSANSTFSHAINRDKESIALDLKSNEDLSNAHAPVAKADIVIQKFRPGVIERLGLGYGT
ncbi:MAG: CoA transferase, partial [Boseongicola sp.]|nr:CoA transferase [Boseongicola sp.]